MAIRKVDRIRRERSVADAPARQVPEASPEMPAAPGLPLASHSFQAISIQPVPLAGSRPLDISGPADPAEHEADAVADRVTQSDPAPGQNSTHERPLASLPLASSIVAGGGAPLDPQVQSDMEPRFGYDFSQVRVHHDPAAARALDARAFTIGGDIVFGADGYTPATSDGRRLIAHELAHVVQDPGGTAVHRKPAGSASNVRERVVDRRAVGERHRTVARIRIVGHASPRWRGARSAKAADENNWRLADQRADSARAEIAALLPGLLPGRDLIFEYEYRRSSEAESREPIKALDEPADVAVSVEGRGSTETLAEAGDRGRSANDDPMRRVDVTVTLHSETETDVESDVERTETKPGATTDWSIWVAGEAGVGGFAKGGGILVQLRNEKTGKTGLYAGYTLGGGLSIGVNVAKTSPPTFDAFTTPEPMTFADFSGASFSITAAGAGIGAFGFEGSRFEFLRFRGGQKVPKAVYDLSLSFGGIEANLGSFVEGKMWLTDTPSETYDETTRSTAMSTFESLDQTSSAHRVLFDTGKSGVDAWQSDLLNEYLMGVVAGSGL